MWKYQQRGQTGCAGGAEKWGPTEGTRPERDCSPAPGNLSVGKPWRLGSHPPSAWEPCLPAQACQGNQHQGPSPQTGSLRLPLLCMDPEDGCLASPQQNAALPYPHYLGSKCRQHFLQGSCQLESSPRIQSVLTARYVPAADIHGPVLKSAASVANRDGCEDPRRSRNQRAVSGGRSAGTGCPAAWAKAQGCFPLRLSTVSTALI